ncbi:MAG: tRNA (N6-threonylcarbamoyladenosine(37)-N6)-methyltransferase TrmO [Desulfobacteraceae bacterium]|nr:tRNA (N6-threonylcarbamoyladenosine(37)-N6)-methyltransferase TrmO [Desulfobacteraceae bacterium]
MKISFNSIGTIHSPFKDRENMPIQPTGASGVEGTIEIEPEYVEGLKDLEGFSHIILLYFFHQTKTTRLTVTPFLDTQMRGVFATRAPSRPNPIGLSIVQLSKIEENVLTIKNIDVMDGTPLIDIKPYVPEFDGQAEARTGWLEKQKGKVKKRKSDKRFL